MRNAAAEETGAVIQPMFYSQLEIGMMLLIALLVGMLLVALIVIIFLVRHQGLAKPVVEATLRRDSRGRFLKP